jgi:hypothetical protein
LIVWIEKFGPISNFDDKLFEIKHKVISFFFRKGLKRVFNNSSNHKNAEIQVGNRLQYIKKILNSKNKFLGRKDGIVNINFWTYYFKIDLISKNSEGIFNEFEIKKIIISNKIFQKNHLVKFINEDEEIGYGILKEIILSKLNDILIIYFNLEILELLDYFNFKNTKKQKKIDLERVFGSPSTFNFDKDSGNYLFL